MASGSSPNDSNKYADLLVKPLTVLVFSVTRPFSAYGW